MAAWALGASGGSFASSHRLSGHPGLYFKHFERENMYTRARGDRAGTVSPRRQVRRRGARVITARASSTSLSLALHHHMCVVAKAAHLYSHRKTLHTGTAVRGKTKRLLDSGPLVGAGTEPTPTGSEVPGGRERRAATDAGTPRVGGSQGVKGAHLEPLQRAAQHAERLAGARRQWLTLVPMPAQLEPCLPQENTLHTLHTLYTL
jgi:hypothetical protein